jgi:heterodisulfide reductase subunit A
VVTDSILIVGSGIAGLTAAVACADAGARAVVVERDAIIGGKLGAAMAQKSSVGESLHGVPIPKLDDLAASENIEILTLAEVAGFDGRPGNFDVSIRERARFVTDACTRCNRCRAPCPVVRPNEHDAGLSYRKAIYAPLSETLPRAFVIDIDACLNTPPNYLPCNGCIDVCDDDAISFDMPLERIRERQVGAVIVATGIESVGPDGAGAQFYGEHPDVVTTAEMERLLTAPGPTGGFAAKPSNEEYPDSVLLILDEFTPWELHTVSSQVERLAEQDIGVIAVLVTTQTGKQELVTLAESLPEGVKIKVGLLQRIEAGDDDRIAVSYAEFSGRRVPQERFDMVVLGSGIRPATGMQELANLIGFEIGEDGFVVRPSPAEACATSLAGVYVAGCAGGPVALGEVAQQGRAAASVALAQLDPRLLRERVAPVAAGPPVAAASEDEVRAWIERALYALLDAKE